MVETPGGTAGHPSRGRTQGESTELARPLSALNKRIISRRKCEHVTMRLLPDNGILPKVKC